jgi:uncharacterized membrane protein
VDVPWTRERVGYLIVGVGVGGLADGFVLHQLLQWHHLWSRRTSDGTVAGLEENTLADGIFHTAMLAVLVGGIALLVDRRVEVRPLVGLALVGWGTFHIIDQLVFHLALGAHHIREHVANPEVYDWTFFAIGLALVAIGAAIARRTAPDERLATERVEAGMLERRGPP